MVGSLVIIRSRLSHVVWQADRVCISAIWLASLPELSDGLSCAGVFVHSNTSKYVRIPVRKKGRKEGMLVADRTCMLYIYIYEYNDSLQ